MHPPVLSQADNNYLFEACHIPLFSEATSVKSDATADDFMVAEEMFCHVLLVHCHSNFIPEHLFTRPLIICIMKN